jgi:hypothetical protein
MAESCNCRISILLGIDAALANSRQSNYTGLGKEFLSVVPADYLKNGARDLFNNILSHTGGQWKTKNFLG